MKLHIVYPAQSHSAYKIAADTFAELAERVADTSSQLFTDEDPLLAKEPADMTVLIGNDAASAVVADLYLSKKTEGFGIRYGTDDYCVRTLEADQKRYLILAGGRPRAVLYAVYRYFESFCGCRWFWDGDRIPHVELPVSGIDLAERPRFDLRGLRYFAHRSLHRFQAEHWSFGDWATEIDWMLKKRLNLFMLRIGMDDLFQKTFPDVVPYPNRDEKLPGTMEGYNDRTLFWSLEYRGELRKKILQYAFERDLMHPEDCGTMSHWYSRTPVEFLDRVKPVFLPQSNNAYSDPTGLVWDIRDPKNFANYCKLTQTHIREYGKDELFHTIGLGERKYSDDPEKNRRMKLYVYHKIATFVKEHYPNAPLLIASWDLWMHFTPAEVRELVADLDPHQAILFDYTSDTVRDNNFTQWGVVNKFPWVFGIFSGYEPNSEIRGYYSLTNERWKTAKSDPMCKGAILWPELSHGDPFVIEYFAQNAWDGETPPLFEQTDRYCRDRYPVKVAEKMCAIWRDLMPIVEMTAWSIDKGSYYQTGNDVFTLPFKNAGFAPSMCEVYREKLETAARWQGVAADLLHRLSRLSQTCFDDAMTKRDLYDIARTVLGRYINAAWVQVQYRFVNGEALARIEPVMCQAKALLDALTELLGSHGDYSLLETLQGMQRVEKVNPVFERTLKENAGNHYCRSYIYENARYLYRPEMDLLFEEVKQATLERRAIDKDRLMPKKDAITARYFETPLDAMERNVPPYAEVTERAAKLIEEMDLQV